MNNPLNLVDPAGLCGEAAGRAHRTRCKSAGDSWGWDLFNPFDLLLLPTLVGTAYEFLVTPGYPADADLSQLLSDFFNDDGVIQMQTYPVYGSSFFIVGTDGGGSSGGGLTAKGCGPAPKGLGILLGGQAGGAAGVWSAGAAASGSAQGGIFFNGRDIVNVGGQISGGAVAYAGGNTAGAPGQLDQPRVVGAYAGYGPALTFTNAGSAAQLNGPFQTASFDIGIGLGKASIQIANSGDIWTVTLSAFSVPISTGVGADISYYTTTTKARGTNKCP